MLFRGLDLFVCNKVLRGNWRITSRRFAFDVFLSLVSGFLCDIRALRSVRFLFSSCLLGIPLGRT